MLNRSTTLKGIGTDISSASQPPALNWCKRVQRCRLTQNTSDSSLSLSEISQNYWNWTQLLLFHTCWARSVSHHRLWKFYSHLSGLNHVQMWFTEALRNGHDCRCDDTVLSASGLWWHRTHSSTFFFWWGDDETPQGQNHDACVVIWWGNISLRGSLMMSLCSLWIQIGFFKANTLLHAFWLIYTVKHAGVSEA